MLSRTRLAVLLALCVGILATTLATSVVGAPVVDAQSTTTTSSTTTTTAPLPSTCTPEAPCSYLGPTWATSGSGTFGYGIDECYNDLTGNVPPDWAYGGGTWACRPTWTEFGDEYRNDSGHVFTLTHLRMFSGASTTNTVRVYSKQSSESWPSPSFNDPFPMQPVATATCAGAGDLKFVKPQDCALSAPVEMEISGSIIITIDHTGARSIGGENTIDSKVAIDPESTGLNHISYRTKTTSQFFPASSGQTYHFGLGPIGYFGRYREPTAPVTTTVPPPVDNPLDLDDVREPPEEALQAQCAFAFWNWQTQRPLGSAGDPSALDDSVFWNDALCLLDMILFAVQGLWETTYDVGRQTLDLLVLGIVNDTANAVGLGDVIYSGLDMLDQTLADLLGSSGPLAGKLDTIAGLLGATGPIGLALGQVVAAVEALELQVTFDGSESFWGPLFDLIASLIADFTGMITSITNTLIEQFVELVDSLSALAVSLAIPSPESVAELAGVVQDVDLLQAGTDLAVLPGEAASAASSGSAACSGEVTVNAQTFSLCDSIATTTANPGWGPVRLMVLGGVAFLALVAFYRRFTHHMEN